MATGIDATFERELLKRIMVDVRPHTTAEQRKQVSTYRLGRQHFEFHGPDSFYWHGNAHSATEARCNGWSAYLKKVGAEGYAA